MPKYLFMFFIFLIGLTSCHDEIFETTSSTGELIFSKDTVYLDTIFTNISSSTRTFKVYNKSNNNIVVPSIRLGRGESSFYRLNVNGESGKTFEEVQILAKDSIFVFVEATVDFSKTTNPLYLDSILFDEGPMQQDVKLVTLVQDAHFLYPKKDADGIKEKIVIGSGPDGEELSVEGFYLDGDAVWEADKPYVIYGYVGVSSGHELSIEEGAEIHFHKNSGMLVDKDARLKIKGSLSNKVVIQGDRLEPFFENIPGQWGAIWLRAGSGMHEIDHAIIKNGSIGLLMDSIPKTGPNSLLINNTEIYNTTGYGLLGRAANIKGANLVIGNNGQSSLACTLGGSYEFAHSTFANYWTGSVRLYPAVLINNYEAQAANGSAQGLDVNDLEAANFSNCIIEGNQNVEFVLDKNETAVFNYNFKNNLLRFDTQGSGSQDPLYDFDDTDHYQNNIFNGEPDFKDVLSNQLIIGQNSDAIGEGDSQTAQNTPLDILGIDRTQTPDIGAYQHIVIEE